MAEQVTVDGGGDFNGAVLENAATEATLERIAKALESQKAGTADKILGMHTRTVNENIKAQERSTGAGQSFTKTLDNMNSASQRVINTFSTIIGTALGTTFGLIQTAGEGLIEFLRNGFDAFQQTAQVGGSFNNNLIDLRKTAAGALIPLGEFTKLILENSDTLASLGGSVTEGSKIFGNTARLFREEFAQELVGAGYSLTQMNESVMTYLDLQARLGKLDTRNINVMTKGTKDYMQELDQVTKLTGISRKQAEELVKKASMDPILNSMMRTAKDQAKAQANMAALTQVGGDQALDMIKSMAARNPSEEAQLLMTQTNASMEEARNILTGGMGSASMLKKMRGYADRLEEQGMLTDEYAEIMAASNPAMANLIRIMMNFQKMKLKDEDIAKMEKEQIARDALTSVFGNIGMALNNIYNKFIVKLTQSHAFEVLVAKLNSLAGAFANNEPIIEEFFDSLVSTFTTSIDNFMENVDREGIIRAIIDLFKDLFSGIKNQVYPIAKSLLSTLWHTTPEDRKKDTTKTLPGAPDESSQQKFLRDQGIPAQQTDTSDFGFDFGPITDGLKTITSYIPSLMEFGSYFGIAGGGAYVAGLGLAAGITEVGSAISSVLIKGLYALGPALASLTVASEAIPVMLSLGGAAAGLGYAFNGIANIIDAAFNSFAKVKDFFTSMQDLDKEKLRGVGEAMMPITGQLAEIGKGAIYNLIGGGGLTNLTDSLQKLGNVDYSKLQGAGPSLASLHDGLKLFTQGGILDNWGESISSWFGSGKIDNILNSLTKFASVDFSKLSASERIPVAISTLQDSINNLNIDQSKIDTLTSVSGAVRTAFNTDLMSSTNNVNSLTSSVDKLVDSLTKLEEQMKKTPTIGENTANSNFAIQPNNTSPIIVGDDPQRQLNMKFDQMIDLLTQMKDSTKDAADSLNHRRSAM